MQRLYYLVFHLITIIFFLFIYFLVIMFVVVKDTRDYSQRTQGCPWGVGSASMTGPHGRRLATFSLSRCFDCSSSTRRKTCHRDVRSYPLTSWPLELFDCFANVKRHWLWSGRLTPECRRRRPAAGHPRLRDRPSRAVWTYCRYPGRPKRLHAPPEDLRVASVVDVFRQLLERVV